GVQDADYEVRINAASLQQVQLDVIEQVKAAYYEVIRQAKIVDVALQAIGRDEQLLAQSQSKLEAGLATRRDQLSAEIILAQDRGKLADAETAYDEALDTLALVMGVRIGHRLELADRDIDLKPVDIDEEAWIAKALRHNPTIRAARLTVQRNRLATRLAGNARLPQLDLSLTYTLNEDADLNEAKIEKNIRRVFLEGDDPKPLDTTTFKGWSTFLTLSYPLGNKSLGNAHKRSQLVYDQSQRNREDIERQITTEIRSAIRNLRNSLVRLEILDKEIEGARDKLEFASINFQLGRASNLDVTDAQKDLMDAEIDYVNEVVDYLVSIARIEALVGGF
ncbi:MAG: TolC family protein, partial [Candidatus Krumholzibacteriia bacterium]